MKKVLIIDDEEGARKIAHLSLKHLGNWSVIEACNGSDGVALARTEKPDAILLDVNMPGMDGFATFEALRDDDSTARIPVVFATAAKSVRELRALRQTGAAGLLLKPVNPLSLPHDLRQALEVVTTANETKK
jgi:CheY-like chemotaxis protein